MKKIFTYLLLVTMVFSFVGCSTKDKVYQIGDTIQVDDVKITVNSTRTSMEGYTSPKDGKEYFIIAVTLENVGDKDVPISEVICFNLADGDGKRQDVSITATLKDRAGGTIAPGGKLVGEVAFETIPASELTLKFRPGIGESVEFKVR